jgi:hypothetical protein
LIQCVWNIRSELGVVGEGAKLTDVALVDLFAQPDEAVLAPRSAPGVLGDPPAAAIGKALGSDHLDSMVELVVAAAVVEYSASVELPVEVGSVDRHRHRSEGEQIFEEAAAVAVEGKVGGNFVALAD